MLVWCEPWEWRRPWVVFSFHAHTSHTENLSETNTRVLKIQHITNNATNTKNDYKHMFVVVVVVVVVVTIDWAVQRDVCVQVGVRLKRQYATVLAGAHIMRSWNVPWVAKACTSSQTLSFKKLAAVVCVRIVRQPDVVGRLKLYCCPFFVNAFFSDVAQRTSIKSIREVRS